MENLHAFTVTWVGPTDTEGVKVNIFSERFVDSYEYVNYDYEASSIAEVAINYLESKGFDIVGQAETHEVYIILSSTFQELPR